MSTPSGLETLKPYSQIVSRKSETENPTFYKREMNIFDKLVYILNFGLKLIYCVKHVPLRTPL